MVTHDLFIREFLNLVLNPPAWDEFHHENCGMTLRRFDGRFTLQFHNRPLRM